MCPPDEHPPCYRSSGQEALLLRGAVFYISMSMWGVQRVNLDLSFASVLPSIKQVRIYITLYQICHVILYIISGCLVWSHHRGV